MTEWSSSVHSNRKGTLRVKEVGRSYITEMVIGKLQIFRISTTHPKPGPQTAMGCSYSHEKYHICILVSPSLNIQMNFIPKQIKHFATQTSLWLYPNPEITAFHVSKPQWTFSHLWYEFPCNSYEYCFLLFTKIFVHCVYIVVLCSIEVSILVFHETFEPTHHKICIIQGVKSLTNYDILEL